METKEEQLLENYRKEQIKLDELEEDIGAYWEKGEQVIEATFTEIQHSAYGDEEGQYILQETYKELEQIEMHYQDVLEKEKKKIYRQREDSEAKYKKDYHSLLDIRSEE